jgi:hypothetical protein
MPKPSKDLTKQSFGRLLVIHRIDKTGPVQWACLCICGQIANVFAYNLLSGKTKSCGCSRASANLTSRKGKRTPERLMFINIKSRARRAGIPFNLEFEDIVIPAVCPLLGIPLMRGVGAPAPSSPSLDKIIPSLGYVKGTVQVISQKANAMKQNATLVEFETMARNWGEQIRGKSEM